MVLLYHFVLKPQFSYQLAKQTMTSGISWQCREDAKCMERFKPYLAHLDKCFTFQSANAIGTDKESQEKKKTELCLQKEFLKDKCEGESTCLVRIDLFFDSCFENTLTAPGTPPEPVLLKKAMQCLKEKMGDEAFRKIYRH